MEYEIKIYLKDEENLNRFVLGNKNKKPLLTHKQMRKAQSKILTVYSWYYIF